MFTRLRQLLSPKKSARQKKRAATTSRIQRATLCAHNGLLPPIEFQDDKFYQICPDCGVKIEVPAAGVAA